MCKIILIFIPAIAPSPLALVRRIEVQAKSLLTVMNMRQTKLTLILCILALGLALLCSISSCSNRKTDDKNPLAQLVDPLIGTDWVGNVYPGATVPFGMVQLSPDNGLPGWDRIAGYFYPDSTIAGFSHTHLSGTGAGDLYDIPFMPVLLPALEGGTYTIDKATGETARLGRHARFRHETEQAHAGYYAVTLEPYDIRVELTASPHIGVQRYTFNRASDSACVILDLDRAMNWDRTTESDVEQVTPTALQGYRKSTGWARDQEMYFYTQLSRTPDSIFIEHRQGEPYGQASGRSAIAYLYYKVKAGDQLIIETALSGTSTQGAMGNWTDEEKEFDFDKYRTLAESLWQERLSRIIIPENAPDSLKKTFYTALYRAQVCPTLYSNTDGNYLGADRRTHFREDNSATYSTFSLWDTYRAVHPLYNLIATKENRDMVQSLIDFGDQNMFHLPVWNMFASETDMMIGHHSIPVIVEAVLKGVYKPADPADLLNLLRNTAERQYYRGLDEYQSRGYVPADLQDESVSKTLEYAYDDAAIAAYAEWMGDSEVAEQYRARAESYKNLWDKGTGFFRPKDGKGRWLPDFNPFAYTKHFTESNAYQYLFAAQHAVRQLEQLMGSREQLRDRLDEFFSRTTPKEIALPIFSTGMIGQYVQGNEPSHHVIFLYNYVNEPWKTADLIHQVRSTLYSHRPDGLCGNEDCGQMSAWYVFAAMGLYPVDPLTSEYEVTTPLFERLTLHLENGRTFTISAPGLSSTRRYIQSAQLNGRPLNRSHITYTQLMQGGELVLTLTDQRGVVWYDK